MAPKLPLISPFEGCAGCLKGDTTTGVVLEGDPEFCIGWLTLSLGPIWAEVGLSSEGVSLESCERAADAFASEVESPGGVHPICLCRECGERAGIEVGPINEAQRPTYCQSDLRPQPVPGALRRTLEELQEKPGGEG